MVQILDNAELHTEGHPFNVTDLAQLARFLNRLAFRLTWEVSGSDRTHQPWTLCGTLMLTYMSLMLTSPGPHVIIVRQGAHVTEGRELRRSVRESCLRLLALLADRDARRRFCPPETWLVVSK